MDEWTWMLLSCVVIFAAGVAQGLTSFGFALIAMPLLAQTLGLQHAVAVVVLLSLLTNISVLAPIWRHVNMRGMWPLIAASLLAAPLGTWLLLAAPAIVLKSAAGLLVAGFALLQLRGIAIPVHNERLSYPLAGALSGLLNGSISFSGPPVALFLAARGMEKHRFRANLTLFALVLNIATLALFVSQDLFAQEELQHVAALLPAMLLGVAAGILLAKRVDENRFKRLILLFLTVSGLWTFLSAIGLST
ncbi:hypothetical protein FHS18_004253 [Paenibacillus phyllosphaerae]|uniref:Probable membrane transporter protein n=1 Tax=Paenibacillus phyllosphaerae TaxID=274593 RepID=A0A7W5B0J2_9BACL|nr:sulfite exporter TauE/SafE family protein [Paenibacillus phyllosphaerae]MBB3112175.1 hypothetical protein [Paenibacillus phyllosphaerae]